LLFGATGLLTGLAMARIFVLIAVHKKLLCDVLVDERVTENISATRANPERLNASNKVITGWILEMKGQTVLSGKS
jgi:hypothetical protein